MSFTLDLASALFTHIIYYTLTQSLLLISIFPRVVVANQFDSPFEINLESFKVSLFNHKLFKPFVFTVLILSVPGIFFNKNYIKVFSNKLLEIMHNFMSGGPRGLYSRKQYRNVDRETGEKVIKRGGNIGGLVNDGNTCFMNSVLQSLASSNTLVSFLDDEEVNREIEEKSLVFTKSFKNLLTNKLNGKHHAKGRDYRTTPLLKTMTKTPNKNFLMGYNQEDAQEFFQSILAELESDFKKILKDKQGITKDPIWIKDLPEDAIIGNQKLGQIGNVYIPANLVDPNLKDGEQKVFQYNLLTPVDGISAERIGCLKCGENGGLRVNVFGGLSLNLPTDNYNALDLSELLDTWTEQEIIEDVDCNRCALKYILDYQQSKLSLLESKADPPHKLLAALKDRITEIETTLSKPIIDDEAYKKLHTKNKIQKSTKSKQILISRPPPLLAIHINRSVFDLQTYRVRKNGAKVLFPLKFDLDPYVAGIYEINLDARDPMSKKEANRPVRSPSEEDDSVTEDLEDDDEGELRSVKSEKSVDAVEQQEESVNVETKEAPSLDSDSDDEDEDEQQQPVHKGPVAPRFYKNDDLTGPLVYQLRSVIVHYGTHNYGHYIAYRKYRGVWWRTSDEDIEVVTEDEVLSTPGVFMLFYELDSLTEELKRDETEEEDLETLKKKHVDISYGNEGKEEEKEENEEDGMLSVDDQAQQLANL